MLVGIPGAQPYITLLLRQFRAGDSLARGELMDIVYATLRRIARRNLGRERSDHTLQSTALVNEVYLKLFGRSEVEFVDRAHFAVVSQAIRQSWWTTRARAAVRRHGEHVPLSTTIPVKAESGSAEINLLDLDLALDTLARGSNSLAQLMEMRYFGGMTAEESGNVVGRSVHAVRHELRVAHASLRRELAQSG